MLQLDAKTNLRTPASRARRPSSTVASSLTAYVTSSNALPMGSFDIAAR